jgi:hypothetical protein
MEIILNWYFPTKNSGKTYGDKTPPSGRFFGYISFVDQKTMPLSEFAC